MKRLLVLFVAVALLIVATPAGAIHRGKLCRQFGGPDGSGGVHIQGCVSVDEHDFLDQIAGIDSISNTGNARAEVHVSYVKLVKGSTTVRETGSFIASIWPNDPTFHRSTPWLGNPSGTFHGRTRMWVCWPTLGGQCGSPVAFNSANVSY